MSHFETINSKRIIDFFISLCKLIIMERLSFTKIQCCQIHDFSREKVWIFFVNSAAVYARDFCYENNPVTKSNYIIHYIIVIIRVIVYKCEHANAVEIYSVARPRNRDRLRSWPKIGDIPNKNQSVDSKYWWQVSTVDFLIEIMWKLI
jgi:hypothetical protein